LGQIEVISEVGGDSGISHYLSFAIFKTLHKILYSPHDYIVFLPILSVNYGDIAVRLFVAVEAQPLLLAVAVIFPSFSFVSWRCLSDLLEVAIEPRKVEARGI